MRIEDFQLYNNPPDDILTWKPHLAINLSGGNEKHGLGIGPRFAGNAVECRLRDTTGSTLHDSYLWWPYANCLETAVINAIAATFMNSVADSVDLLLKPLLPLMQGRQPLAAGSRRGSEDCLGGVGGQWAGLEQWRRGPRWRGRDTRCFYSPLKAMQETAGGVCVVTGQRRTLFSSANTALNKYLLS